jgi:hypothetical protein
MDRQSRDVSIWPIWLVRRRFGVGACASAVTIEIQVGKTEATGMRLDEAKKINQSLSALGLCISKLTTGHQTHVP